MAVTYNPFLPENRLDPYPHYHALREEDPVHAGVLIPGWVLTRYADVHAVLRDPRFSVDRTRSKLFSMAGSPMNTLSGELRDSMLKMMLFQDPPNHTRLRNLVNKAFTRRMVERLRGRIEKTVDDLLDAACPAGEMDVVGDLAFPLPVTVIGEMLGVPVDDAPLFLRWSRDLVAITEPTALFVPEVRARAETALGEMRAYFREQTLARRKRPRDDLLGALARAEEEGDRLSEDELFAMCVLILVAGHETTANLIGNAVLALLRHPGERKRLVDDPGLLPGAVEEFLRYDSVVQATVRVAVTDLEIEGRRIEEGDLAILVLAAANRDQARFPEPDRLDVARRDNQHLAFGQGAHFCLGAGLARAEAQIALGRLLARVPSFDGDTSQPDYKPTALLRGLRSLPISLRS